MKTQYLLIPMLLLSACRTTAGTKDKPTATKTYAGQSEPLLRKRVDEISKSNAQVYDCTVTAKDVGNAEEVRKLIAAVPQGKDSWGQGYHIVATVPSIEYFAYDSKGEFLLYEDHSMMRFRVDANGKSTAMEELKVIADKYCPGPQK